jgi:HEAT repeat protein
VTYQLQSTTITLEAALRDLDSKSPKIRAMAAHALGDVVDPEARAQAAGALIRALRDDRPEVRSEAAMSLGALDSEAAVEPLAARLQDFVPVVRQAAAISLGRLGFASAFEPMARALAEGPPDLRFQAATSLAEIDPDRAGEPLMQALSDADGEVIAAAALALGAIGEARARDPLASLLETWKTPRTRFDIAYALADLDDERAIDVLAGFVEEREMGWDAIEALQRSGMPRAADPLRPLLGRVLLDRNIKLRAAAAVIALLPGDDADAERARAVLIAGLDVRKLQHRGLAVQLLGTVGGPWAVKPLNELRQRRAGRQLSEEIEAALAEIARRTP